MVLNLSRLFPQYKNNSSWGYVITKEFLGGKKWTNVLTPYLENEIKNKFNPILIHTQRDYDKYKRQLKYIISMEPGWGAEKIVYDKDLDHRVGVFVSDPHNKVDWFQKYILDNNITYAFSFYKSPFFYHFPDFPRDRFLHTPWSIPDSFVGTNELSVRSKDVVIFGGKASDAYDLRNWCREQKEIMNYNNSGVENKVMSDKEYYEWLQSFDAVVAAGSSLPQYELVTPKYFEIAAAGALLFGQKCKDLETLGFNDSNAVIFTKDNFLAKVKEYKRNPEEYLERRELGRKLIVERHTLSKRIETIRQALELGNIS